MNDLILFLIKGVYGLEVSQNLKEVLVLEYINCFIALTISIELLELELECFLIAKNI